MSIEEKECMLKEILQETDCLNENDKFAVMAYIRGTRDTRERIKSENEKSHSKLKDI
ncbi:Uncharacterised protein [[Clostridium] sordellii]|uniref:hypothetical protein n=1 Tax=Paraclostridium sordellii TaxID=1505 RepID=UPI0005DED2C5|nr:hypothetical protein [Paeniclostridium sordellii]CEP50252.1 Uncharacterised protein [[Clostridium] sordellii] [Paeniclostridium sordellii]